MNTYKREVIFTQNGWSLIAHSEEGVVRGVFLGDHALCGNPIIFKDNRFGCHQCCIVLEESDRNVLMDALRLLNDTIVVKYTGGVDFSAAAKHGATVLSAVIQSQLREIVKKP